MSRSAARLKRVPPARRAPIRNPLAPPTAAGSGGGPSDPTAYQPPFGASARGANPGEPILGALENGVRTAYAVIDEYMRRGYEAAGFNHNGNKRGPMGDKKDYWQDPSNTIAALTEQWLTMMRTWTELWSSFIPRTWPQGAWSPTAPSAPTIGVRVVSRRQTEVTASLRPGADLIELVADPLFTRGRHEPPIDPKKISFERGPGTVRVIVEIDDAQPTGRYEGAIRNKADRSEAGSLVVVINPPMGAV